MIFDNLTAVTEANMVHQLAKMGEEQDAATLRTAQLLYDNATSPEYPKSMTMVSRDYRKLAWTPVAVTAMIVDKIASMLYSRHITRSTGIEDLDAKFEAGPWQEMPRLMLRVSKQASIGGYTVIRLRPVYPGNIGYATYLPSDAKPILDPDNPHGAPVGMVYDYMDEPMLAQINRRVGGSSAIVHVKEVVTRHIRDKDGKIVQPGIHGRLENDELVPLDDGGYNVLGDYLDCILWRGSDHPTDGCGRSDIYPIMQTLKAINELMTDAHELVQWNVWPMLVTDDPDADIIYTPRTIARMGDTPRGSAASLKRVEWGGNEVRAWKEYFEYVMSLARETARVPAISTGDLANIGQLSSGRAFEIAMTPLLELTREKEVVAMQQERELMETTVAMMAYYGLADSMTSYDKVTGFNGPDAEKIHAALEDSTVEFEPVKLPKDRMAEAQIHSVLTGAGVESVEQAIRALHPEWSDEEVGDELKRVGADEPEQVEASVSNRIRAAQDKLKQEAE